MLLWDRVTRSIPGRFKLTVVAAVGLYVGASLVMKRTPVEFIATGLTLDPWTGYYRLQIWEWGMLNVWANPWVGIGHNDWVRAEWMAAGTADSLWLVIMMQQGLPAIALIGLAIVLLTRAVALRIKRTSDPMEQRIARGWIMSLIALAMLACTVHLWNAVYAYLFFFLGSAGWIADPVRRAMTKPTPASSRPARRASRRRTPPPLPALDPTTIWGPYLVLPSR
jgi:hypothetical protein